jgi:hypothetical protein
VFVSFFLRQFWIAFLFLIPATQSAATCDMHSCYSRNPYPKPPNATFRTLQTGIEHQAEGGIEQGREGTEAILSGVRRVARNESLVKARARESPAKAGRSKSDLARR